MATLEASRRRRAEPGATSKAQGLRGLVPAGPGCPRWLGAQEGQCWLCTRPPLRRGQEALTSAALLSQDFGSLCQLICCQVSTEIEQTNASTEVPNMRQSAMSVLLGWIAGTGWG